MKKFLITLLAFVLCFTTVLGGVSAFAAGTPSKAREDMTVVHEIKVEKPSGGEVIKILSEEEQESKEYKETKEICDDEIDTLADVVKADKPVEEYFEEAKDAGGKAVDFKKFFKKVLGTEDAKVHELWPVVAGGFEKGCGKTEVTMGFATPYEEGEKVVVMIGVITVNKDGSHSVEWFALEGVGVKPESKDAEKQGLIKFELSEELVHMIQENHALLAVVSK